MRFFVPSIDVDPKEGFDPAKDIFHRAPIGHGLTRLVTASADPLALAVNGPWGTGKSTFLLMWASELRKAEFPVIYFDAFAHDYVEDAFSALAGEIIALAKENLKPAASKKIKDAAISAGKVLLKVGASVGVRAATAGLLNSTELSEVVEDAKTAVGDATDKILEDALTTRKKQKKTLENFRTTLGELPALLSNDQKPLIFIIDELDRCKPPFALAILERVKHFFTVPGVHFILGAHIKQLENSVAATYGAGVDAQLYLQKFISLTIDLDTPGEHDNESEHSISRYMKYLLEKMEFGKDDRETVTYASELISDIARHQGLSLRTLEKIMSVLAIALAYTGKNYMRLPPIIAGLCVMKIVRPDLFAKARFGTLSYDEVEEFFNLRQVPSEEGRWPLDYFTKWWRYGLDPNLDQESIGQMERALFSFNVRNRRRIVQVTANNVIDRFARGGGP